jgi:hypothetical protein
MTDKRWGIFVKTDEGLRSRRLREHDWNEQVGLALLAVVLVGAAVGRSLGAF